MTVDFPTDYMYTLVTVNGLRLRDRQFAMQCDRESAHLARSHAQVTTTCPGNTHAGVVRCYAHNDSSRLERILVEPAARILELHH